MENSGEHVEQREIDQKYLQTFEELMELGSIQLGQGQEVTFQPWGRYENERQVGTVRLWKSNPDVIAIVFMGSKVGVPYPDSERVTKEQFEQRKDIWKIRKK